jgi:hypothetical protein
MLDIIFVSMMDDFVNGDFISGVQRPITNLIGEWWYTLFFGMIFTLVYFRTQSTIMPTVVFILIAPIALFLMPPGAAPAFYIFISISVAGTLFQAYTHRGG